MLSRVALGGHKSAPVSHKHILSNPSFSSPLINKDLLAGPQLVFTLNNRFFRHQACYSLLSAKPGGQADRVVSLCKYKVVGQYHYIVILGRPCITIKERRHQRVSNWSTGHVLAFGVCRHKYCRLLCTRVNYNFRLTYAKQNCNLIS